MSVALGPPIHCRRCVLWLVRQGKHASAPRGAQGYCYSSPKLKYAPQLQTTSQLPQASENPKHWVSRGVPKYKVMQDYRKSMEIVSDLKPSNFPNTTVIDANPGPGIFSRALYNQIAPKSHVLLDPGRKYQAALEPMVKLSNGIVKYLDRSPWLFKSYSDFLDTGIVEFEQKKPNEDNPSLLFVANLMDDDGWKSESIAAHLISFMHKQCFIYGYGRIRTWLWIQTPNWIPLLAPPGHKSRKKITVMREMICDARVLAFSGKTGREIAENNFDASEARFLKTSMFYPSATAALLELIPYARQDTIVPPEELDYLVLKMMTVKDRSLPQALKVTAPGAEILLNSLGPHEGLTPATLMREQWLKLSKAFHEWPFKPDVLEDETQYLEGRSSIDEKVGYAADKSQTMRAIEEMLTEEGEDEKEGEEYEEFAASH